MKILVHICCGPCAVVFVNGLADIGIKPVLFWYNPNIHPFTEYKNRKESARKFAEFMGLKIDLNDYYGLREFTAGVVHNMDDKDKRCSYCYSTRMEYTAKYAAQKGFDSFSTTLLASPYQDHKKINQYAEKFAKIYGIKFETQDFRQNYRAGKVKARDMELYMQKYCGCIFSEEERYRNIN